MSLNPIAPGGTTTSGGDVDPALAQDVADLKQASAGHGAGIITLDGEMQAVETRAGLLEGRATALEARPAPKRDVWQLLGFVRLTAGGTWNRDAFINSLAAGVSHDDLRLDGDVVGPGASGFNGGGAGGAGGAPGGVTRIRMVHPDSIPSTVAVAIGAGGAATPRSLINPASNAGGVTTFGNYRALGGKGSLGSTSSNAFMTAYFLPPSDVSLSPAVAGTLSGPTIFAPVGSFGPGGGGAGDGGNNANGTAGCPSGYDLVDSSLSGGTAGIFASSTLAGNGLTPTGAYGFGSGGGGGYGNNAAGGRGGNGGAFGGGGGGGGNGNSGNLGGQESGGTGGNGGVCIRLFGRIA